MFLSDKEILRLVEKNKDFIFPFLDHKTDNDFPSAGLEPAGYTFRLSDEYYIPKMEPDIMITKSKLKDYYSRAEKKVAVDGFIEILPQQHVILTSFEKFNMPKNVGGICFPKSTYAKLGLMVDITSIEPGWRGYLAVGVTNLIHSAIYLFPGSGLAQIHFFKVNSQKIYEGMHQDLNGIISNAE